MCGDVAALQRRTRLRQATARATRSPGTSPRASPTLPRWVMARALVPGRPPWVNTAVSVPETTGAAARPGPGSAGRLLAGGWADALELGGGLVLVDQVSWPSVRAGGSARGSWLSPVAPNLRGDHELITVACPGTPGNAPAAGGHARTGARHRGRPGSPRAPRCGRWRR